MISGAFTPENFLRSPAQAMDQWALAVCRASNAGTTATAGATVLGLERLERHADPTESAQDRTRRDPAKKQLPHRHRTHSLSCSAFPDTLPANGPLDS